MFNELLKPLIEHLGLICQAGHEFLQELLVAGRLAHDPTVGLPQRKV